MKYKFTIILTFTIADTAVSKYFEALAEELVTRGYKLILITDGCKQQLINPTSNPAIYTWPSKRPTKIKDAIFLARIIREYRPVAILSNFGSVNISLLISWLFKVKLRYASYRTSADYDFLNGREKFKQEFFKLRKIFVYKFATMLFPVSEAMVKELEEIFKVPRKKIKYFHNALEDPLSINLAKKNQNQKNLICVGRLNFGKGQDLLINAVPIIKKSYPDIQLNFLGSGDWKEDLETLVSKLGLERNIHFLGHVPHHDIFGYISNAYVLILPTRFEAFSFVIIEAMSVGTPVIASKIGGIPEIIRHGIDGYLVSTENIENLAEKILELLNNPNLRERMSKNARQNFLDNFELSKAIKNRAEWIENEIRMLGLP